EAVANLQSFLGQNDKVCFCDNELCLTIMTMGLIGFAYCATCDIRTQEIDKANCEEKIAIMRAALVTISISKEYHDEYGFNCPLRTHTYLLEGTLTLLSLRDGEDSESELLLEFQRTFCAVDVDRHNLL